VRGSGGQLGHVAKEEGGGPDGQRMRLEAPSGERRRGGGCGALRGAST
jgi:hypothetical protein